MTDIDWLAVEYACDGYAMKLTEPEQRAAIRRMQDRMAAPGEWDCYSNILTTAEVGRRLRVDERTVLRRKKALPAADRHICPVCRNDMWVTDDGVIEPHPAALYKECPTSGKQPLQGLAAVRPELYRWAWSA
jgi:hypothetical protein